MNPQWTPLRGEAPEWMQLGFKLFDSLKHFAPPEVFPTAGYRMLQGDEALPVSIHFADFAAGPKDMLDACIGAATVLEYDAGRGEAVGGGDGLANIVLPRPIIDGRIAEVFQWPELSETS